MEVGSAEVQSLVVTEIVIKQIAPVVPAALQQMEKAEFGSIAVVYEQADEMKHLRSLMMTTDALAQEEES